MQLTVDTGGNLYVTDLGTSHGTNVDGTWIRPNEPKQLPKGAVLRLAASSRQYKVSFHFRVDEHDTFVTMKGGMEG